jgi:Ca2+-binding RTX toxin-like protein
MLARSLARYCFVLMAVVIPAVGRAAPTIGSCSTAQHPLGVASTCPTGMCTFDVSTSTLTCDLSAETSATKGFVVNASNSGATHDWVFFGARFAGDLCCTIDDAADEVDAFRILGGTADDQLGYRFCDGTLSTLQSDTSPTCTGLNFQLATTNARPLSAEVLGGAGGDLILGTDNTAVSEVLRGNGGPDQIVSGLGNDVLYGGANPTGFGGRDLLYAGGGNDTIYGEDGPDECLGGDGNDTLNGGPGDDPELLGGPGDDLILGGPGDDEMEGGAGADRLFGEDGSDILEGQAGDDTLCDGGDFDRLVGGANSDFLWYDDTAGDTPDAATTPDGSTPAGLSDVCSVSIVPSTGCESFISVLPQPAQCTP